MTRRLRTKGLARTRGFCRFAHTCCSQLQIRPALMNGQCTIQKQRVLIN